MNIIVINITVINIIINIVIMLRNVKNYLYRNRMVEKDKNYCARPEDIVHFFQSSCRMMSATVTVQGQVFWRLPLNS